MLESSAIRFMSLMMVMSAAGLGWYFFDLFRQGKKGIEKSEAAPGAGRAAKKVALVAAFLYMVAMVSVAGLFF